MRVSTVLKIAVALPVALVVTAVAVIYNLDFDAYKGDIAAAVKDATGRDLIIEGELRPSIGLVPAISVGRVRFANAPWGSRPHMATIESFRAEIELLPILTGELRIKRVVLVGADILLETRPDGTGNWMMGSPEAARPKPAATEGVGAGTIPTVNLVSIEQSRLEYRDGGTGKSTVFKIDRLRARADNAGAPLEINFRGSFNDAPVTLDGMLGSLARVMSGTDALPLDLTVIAGGATLALKGAIARPLDAKGVRIAVSVEGRDLALLGPLAGQPVPSIGPYKLAATVSDAGQGWSLKDLSVIVGQSSLLGEATVDVTTRPPMVNARLTSPLLRLADFQDRGAPAKPGARPRAKGDGRVFPADPLPFAALRALDARVTFRATRIEAPKAVLSDVAVDLLIDGGRLEIKPARLKFAGGTVAAEVMVESVGQVPKVAVKLDALGLDLAVLLKDAGRPGLVTGKVDFGGDVKGFGNSVRAVMARLNGTLQVTMKDGRLRDDLIDMASADLLKLLSPFGSREKGIGINCLVGRYTIERGRLRSLVTLFDTTRASVRGKGGANLANETLDFSLVPHAKEVSVMALLVPVKITGQFAAPSIYPDAEGIAKGAVGMVTGVVTGTAGVIGSVFGGVVGDRSARPASTASNNPCVAALSGKPPAVGPAHQAVAPQPTRAPQPAPAPESEPEPSTPGNPSLPDAVERTLKGIGEGLGKGLRSLFGQ